MNKKLDPIVELKELKELAEKLAAARKTGVGLLEWAEKIRKK